MPAAPTVRPAPARSSARPTLLVAAAGGDGDSWRDTAGREYRLGLVNAPEVGECFGSQATAKRKSLLRNGFTADAYAVDTYGRSVSVVRTRDGVVVNVHLARYGFVDDRYLERFRHENPTLARQLDAAFAAAKRERAGLGVRVARRRRRPPRPRPHRPATATRSYVTCIPVKGDGSGRGEANDLDCGDLDGPVRLRSAGDDPYRLDRDGDLVACE